MTTPAATAAGKATTRAAGAQRTLIGLLGLLILVTGTAALVVGSGLLGADRAARPVIGSVAVDAHQALTRGVAIAAGTVVLVLGLLWTIRALTPERRPGLVLDSSPDHRLEISAPAIADALRADAETIDGVSRARARMVGTTDAPVLRLNLWLENGADVRDVYHDLNTRVLARARDSFGLASLPSAIRIELDAAPARVR